MAFHVLLEASDLLLQLSRVGTSVEATVQLRRYPGVLINDELENPALKASMDRREGNVRAPTRPAVSLALLDLYTLTLVS